MMDFELDDRGRGWRWFGAGLSYVGLAAMLGGAFLLMKFVVAMQWLGSVLPAGF
jgi:hypothetical protein